MDEVTSDEFSEVRDVLLNNEESELYSYIALPEGQYAVGILRGFHESNLHSVLVLFEQDYPKLADEIKQAMNSDVKITEEQWDICKSYFNKKPVLTEDEVNSLVSRLKAHTNN